MQRITLLDDAVLDGDGNPIFADSNPPLLDTVITSDWLNSVQEEIAHVVESSGQVLDIADKYQLTKAIRNVDAILSDLTLTVNGSAPYPKLKDAFDALRGRFIGPTVTVTIQLAPGVHTQNQPLFILHPQGEHIVIKGNDADPTTTQLNVTATLWTREQGAITVEAGGRLGGMSGFQLIQVGTAPNFPVFGIKASTGGRMKLGNVQVLNWSGCNIMATSGGVIIADGTLANNAQFLGGVWDYLDPSVYGNNWHARDNGVINVKNANCTAAYRNAFCAETGGLLRMDYCNATTAPVVARDGGVVYAWRTVVKSCPSNAGFYSNQGGRMILQGCTSGLSGFPNLIGYHANRGSLIQAESCTSSYNATYGWKGSLMGAITGGFNTSTGNVTAIKIENQIGLVEFA